MNQKFGLSHAVHSWGLGICLLLCPLATRGQWLQGYQARVQVDLEHTNLTTASAHFYPGGLCRKDGNDIRVMAGNSPVKFSVPSFDPDGRTHVVFDSTSGTRRFVIYYGNPKEEKKLDDWTPTTGLLMTTYIGGGTAGTVDPCRKMINPLHSYGSDFVAQVFFGYHPFGPPENFTAYLRGPVSIPTSGEWSFATDSHDSSFLLIDGKVIASAPGGHGPSGQARAHGEVKLEKGDHKFEYFYMLGGQPPLMVAAWKPPGGKKYEQIPASAFPDASTSKVASYEKQGKAFAAFFKSDFTTDVLRGGIQATLLEFSVVKYGSLPVSATYEWDFGDGIKTKTKETTISHAYFSLDNVLVTLTVLDGNGAAQDSFRRLVRILPAMGDPPADEAARITKVAEAVKSYSMETLNATAGGMMLRFLTAADQRKTFIQLLEREMASGHKITKFHTELGDAYFDELQFDKALEQYRLTITDQPFAVDAHLRQRLIECQIRVKKYDEALKATQDAYEHSAKSTPRPLDRGTFLNQFTANVKIERFDEAARLLENYCSQHSLVLLEGQTYLMRAQMLEKAKQYDAALSDLEFAEKVDPKSNYLPEILFEQAQCLTALGRGADARKRADFLKKTFPYSPFAARNPQTPK